MSDFVSGILEEMTIDDVRALAANVALIPCGSTEPHGPALPYGTDSFTVKAIAELATRQANRRGSRAICYPTLPITLNNNFRHWPFACRISVRTFMSMLGDIIEQAWADGIRRVVVVNGHGGTTDAIKTVQREFAGRRDAPFIVYTGGWGMADSGVIQEHIKHPSDHGGEAEASVTMHTRPELVRRDKLANNPFGQPALETLRNPKVHFVKPWHLHVPASAGGEQRTATPEKGRAIIESAAQTIANLVVELSQTPESETFPS